MAEFRAEQPEARPEEPEAQSAKSADVRTSDELVLAILRCVIIEDAQWVSDHDARKRLDEACFALLKRLGLTYEDLDPPEPLARPEGRASARVSGTPEGTPSEPDGKSAGDELAVSTSGSLGAAEAGKAEALATRLRAEADTADKATAFMGDAELVEDTQAEIEMLREAGDALDSLLAALAAERARAATAETALAGARAAIEEYRRGYLASDSPGRRRAKVVQLVSVLAASGGAAQPEEGKP